MCVLAGEGPVYVCVCGGGGGGGGGGVRERGRGGVWGWAKVWAETLSVCYLVYEGNRSFGSYSSVS